MVYPVCHLKPCEYMTIPDMSISSRKNDVNSETPGQLAPGDPLGVVGKAIETLIPQLEDELHLQPDDLVDFIAPPPNRDGFANGRSRRLNTTGSFPLTHVVIVEGRLPEITGQPVARRKSDWWKPCDYYDDESDDHKYIELESSAAKPGYSYTTATALYDYEATHEGDLTFNKGDRILKVIRFNDAWLRGELLNSQLSGIFPANFVSVHGPLDTEQPRYDATSPPSDNHAISDNYAISDNRDQCEQYHASSTSYVNPSELTAVVYENLDKLSRKTSPMYVEAAAATEDAASSTSKPRDSSLYTDPSPIIHAGVDGLLIDTDNYMSPADALLTPGRVIRDYTPTCSAAPATGDPVRLAVKAGDLVNIILSCHDGWFLVRRKTALSDHLRGDNISEDARRGRVHQQQQEGLVACDNVNMDIDETDYQKVNDIRVG